MSKIHGMMDVGKRSMMNSQTALQTTGHNIANKSTEGYSRQRVELQTAEPLGMGKLRIGTGAKSAAITRTNNPYLEKQIQKEQANLGYLEGKADAMTRVEQVYNEQMNKGLNQFSTDFFNSFREFANNPESLATRTQVKETADHMTQDFARVNKQLTEIQRDLDQQVAVQVDQVNEITKELASLNEKVQMVEASGAPANDERDRRDLLIKQLGQKINIRWAEGADGNVTVTAGQNALLVTGNEAKRLDVKSTPAEGAKGEGNFDVFYHNSERSTAIRVTDQLNGGSLGGLLEVRDKTINGLLDQVDNMAYTLGSTVNELHQRGFDVYNKQGATFFELPKELKGASANLKLNEAIAKDVGKIASAAQRDAPGDNRVANAISKLQFEGVIGDNKATLDEYYNSMVGEVGIQTRRTTTEQDSQKNIVNQLKNIRESISGVSLDEETTRLIEYQKGFDASARLIRTADEMFDTVLNLKRM
ncbi:MAG: flagellar hook-associated protein FlgK [Bdellovibrionota bacterium]